MFLFVRTKKRATVPPFARPAFVIPCFRCFFRFLNIFRFRVKNVCPPGSFQSVKSFYFQYSTCSRKKEREKSPVLCIVRKTVCCSRTFPFFSFLRLHIQLFSFLFMLHSLVSVFYCRNIFLPSCFLWGYLYGSVCGIARLFRGAIPKGAVPKGSP